MLKFFRRMKHDRRGAVTVFVTLMLIPAVLMSGTGVDLARIYVARSELHDANQLAANSALASYDALLQDLYGLFGITPEKNYIGSANVNLNEIVEKYVKAAVPSSGSQKGAFSHLSVENLLVGTSVSGHLGIPEILRRQIEEYAKFRAIPVIAEEILGKLDNFEKIQEDASVIKDKMEIEDRIDEIDEIYEKIYKCIGEINKIGEIENKAVNSINKHLEELRGDIDNLKKMRDEYPGIEDEEEKELKQKQYRLVFGNLNSRINGGYIYEGESAYPIDGMKEEIERDKRKLDESLKKLKELEDLAERAEKKKKDLKKRLEDLEDKLNSGKCSGDLRKGLTEPSKPGGESYIEQCRTMLEYNVEAMADAVNKYDSGQIKSVKNILENVKYGNPKSAGWCLTLDELAGIKETDTGYGIDYVADTESGAAVGLDWLYGIEPKWYKIEQEFKRFDNATFIKTKNGDFYSMLTDLYQNKGNRKKKGKIIKALEEFAGGIQEEYKSLLNFEPLGADKYFEGSDENKDSEACEFGKKGDWGAKGGAKENTKKALSDNLLKKFSDLGNQIVDKLLLLTYDSEMFSCFTTEDGYSGGDSGGETEINMAYIPLGIEVNYYFQSELEYLFNGNLNNAKANLAAVAGIVFLIRFVMDYTASFCVESVNSTVRGVVEALGFLGPAAIAIGELVRLVMAFGEGVSDFARLKDGEKVAVFKDNSTWTFSAEGIIEKVVAATGKNIFSGEKAPGAVNVDEGDERGMTYKDYVRMLLMLVPGNILAERTSNLIELNMTNYKNGIGGLSTKKDREHAMTDLKTADRFVLSKAVTDFKIVTVVDLKMMFLSSPVAQSGYVNGIVPPKTKQLRVVDCRGY